MKKHCLSLCFSMLCLVMLTLSNVQSSASILAASPPPKTLQGYIPAAVINGQAHLIGPHAASDRLALAIGLPLRNEQALVRFIQQASTPHNSLYRHYLTQAQANQAFNPTPQQEQQVISWLQSHGLTVTHTYPNHLLVDVTGTFAQIEQVFHITINDYTMQFNGGQITFYAPANNPSVDGSVASVIDSIVGLDNYPSFTLDDSVTPTRPASNGNAHGSPPYYPQDFADAYDVNPLWKAGDTGGGQHIGIIVWGPAPTTALKQFDAQTGAQYPNIQPTIMVDGGAPYTQHAAEEAGLDVESASGMAPGATIDYYDAPQTDKGLDDALETAGTDNNNNDLISNSWGECEDSDPPFITQTEQILQSNTATGHDYFFASGDTGSTCGKINPWAEYPATSAYATSVGGTHFTSNINGRYRQETAWSGSGGGYSFLFAEPSWQSANSIPDPNSMRGIPDVAADADPHTSAYSCYDDGPPPDPSATCTDTWGTSLATPLWAGMIADVNQYVQKQGEPALGFIDPMLYEMSLGLPYTAFHDITKGNNGYYKAGRGWDAVTGLGSPDLYHLALDTQYFNTLSVTLSSVAAVSANDVWAVGYSVNKFGSNYGDNTLIEHWNGSNWAVVPSPNPGRDNYLSGVAAVSATDVWAVGYSTGASGNNDTLIEQWDGSSWQVISSPNYGPSDTQLSGVAAVSASDIWAVGTSINANGNQVTLTEQWNGSSWQIVSTSSPGQLSNELNSVAAVSASDVWAIGYYANPNYNGELEYTLTEQWNGSGWNVVSSPSPDYSVISFSGVAAISANDVWAVGSYSPNSPQNTLIEKWNGSSWNVVASPNPNLYNQLNSVAAVSATDVWAVGYSQDTNENIYTLVEQWNGSSWNVVSSPSPDLASILNGVVAVSATDVWAVGSYVFDHEYSYSLIEHWNGKQWKVMPSPL